MTGSSSSLSLRPHPETGRRSLTGCHQAVQSNVHIGTHYPEKPSVPLMRSIQDRQYRLLYSSGLRGTAYTPVQTADPTELRGRSNVTSLEDTEPARQCTEPGGSSACLRQSKRSGAGGSCLSPTQLGHFGGPGFFLEGRHQHPRNQGERELRNADQHKTAEMSRFRPSRQSSPRMTSAATATSAVQMVIVYFVSTRIDSSDSCL